MKYVLLDAHGVKLMGGLSLAEAERRAEGLGMDTHGIIEETRWQRMRSGVDLLGHALLGVDKEPWP